MKQIEFTILGQSYKLGCPDGGEALLRAAAATVDREMTSISDAGKVKARERMAVLAALNVAYQLAEQSTQLSELRAQLEEHAARVAALTQQLQARDQALEAARAAAQGPAVATDASALADPAAAEAANAEQAALVEGLIGRLDAALAEQEPLFR